METKKLLTEAMLIGLLLAVPAISPATTVSIQEPPGRKEHLHGPPPEAYVACKGKQAGEAVTIKTPHGDTLAAVCESMKDRLVVKPLNEPPPRPGQGKE